MIENNDLEAALRDVLCTRVAKITDRSALAESILHEALSSSSAPFETQRPPVNAAHSWIAPLLAAASVIVVVTAGLFISHQITNHTGHPVPVTSAAVPPPAPSATVRESSGPVPSAAPTSATGGHTTSPALPAVPSQAVAACVAESIHIAATVGQEVSHDEPILLIFTNIGSSPCRTFGYPGVAVVDASGRQTRQATRTPRGLLGGLSSGQPPAFTLAPGQQAAALVEGDTLYPNGASCPDAPGLLVTMPDDTVSTRIAVKVQDCEVLEVHPILPGTTGRQQ